jgi:D-glycero-alpha-D-manno-heptose-7-phosphate kinase
MIITQTPLRISFAGGGTDFADFYGREGGCVVSSAIDKYVFVIVKERFDEKIRVGYSRTEMVDSIDEIEHELVRESLRKVGIKSGIEISTMADVPSEGSGLGSSSTVTVGLLNALYAYKGEMRTAEDLARQACEIEIDILGKPIGKQDQYIAAYGGIRRFRFLPDENVEVDEVKLDKEHKRLLQESLMLFYTGVTRQASSILGEQKNNIDTRMDVLKKMRDQAETLYRYLSENQVEKLGEVLKEGWNLKKTLANGITNSSIDTLYEKALEAGAIGGKVAGAGGGGFLLIFCPPEKRANVRKALCELRELPFGLERDGTKVIFNVRR